MCFILILRDNRMLKRSGSGSDGDQRIGYIHLCGYVLVAVYLTQKCYKNGSQLINLLINLLCPYYDYWRLRTYKKLVMAVVEMTHALKYRIWVLQGILRTNFLFLKIYITVASLLRNLSKEKNISNDIKYYDVYISFVENGRYKCFLSV